MRWVGRVSGNDGRHGVGIRPDRSRGDADLRREIAGRLSRLFLISVATVGAPVSDMRAKLGNEVAMKAFRAGTLPFPDGTIIARLAWKQTTSEENNRALGPAAEKQLGPEAAQKLLSQSFVAGPAINVQFMVKDSTKYASIGGWGFAQFDDGKPADQAVHKTCFACHSPAKDRDFVFTRYWR